MLNTLLCTLCGCVMCNLCAVLASLQDAAIRTVCNYPTTHQHMLCSPVPQVVAVYKDDGSRGHHMQDFIPQEEMAKFLAQCGDSNAKVALEHFQERNAIGADNIGHKLLQKMGWKEGEGIGASGLGITTPVAATAAGVKQDNLGLGAAAHGAVEDTDDAFEQYRKRMMLGYKYRPNPLGNPRKQYY